MGFFNYSILDLILKVRSWVSELVTESLVPSGDERCCRCRENSASLAFKYRCGKCGQLLCRKCLLSAPSKSDQREKQPVYCEFCIRAANGPEVASRTSDRTSVRVSPLILPEDVLPLQSPLSRSRNGRISSAESWQSCSPRFLCSSPYMNVEEEESDDEGKEFLTPASALSHDFSDTDSVSTNIGNEFCSSSSVSPSPSYSPCRLIEQESVSPLLEKICISDQGSPYHIRKYAADSENLLEDSDQSTCDNLEEYHNPERDDATPQLNFENDEIFYPPPAKDEGVDIDASCTTFTDEYDDIGKSNKLFESSSPSRHLLQRNMKYSEVNKEHLKASFHEHFKTLVAQLLKEESIQADGLEEPEWLEIVSSLAWEAANYIKPSTSRSGSMDPSEYVKVKCIPSGNPYESTLVKGIVCTKNVKHKRMVSQHKNPRLLLLGGALECQKVPNELASLQHLLEQEINYMKMTLSQIEALQPNVIIVEKSASLYAQEYLLGKKDVSLVLNVKKPLLERIARCTGAQIVPSIDYVASAELGHCDVFRTEKIFEKFVSSKHPKRNSSTTLMFFEGSPQRLGCTVLIRGSCHEELKKVKHVLQYSIFAAYHLSLETAFLADEGAMLPRLQISPSVNKSKKLIEAHDCVSLVSNLALPDNQSVENDHKNDRSFSKQDIRSSPEVSLSGSCDSIPGFHCDAPSSVSPLRTDRILSGDKNEDSEFSSLDKTSGDYFTADNQQSILVSVSSSCSKTRRVCERPQLYRIKFYSSSDKPLGRYLQEYLFDEKYSCRSCKMPTEAHVRCYTHQQGSLTIVTRQLTSMKLPGQHERKIWMWHRCLKCKKDEGEVPPATGRVVMSDAAWGLSFGKFLELNFSRYATSRIASCGHSLQKDCLRFYGCGPMVAVLYYSPADILSVCLPPELLDFTGAVQPEWLRQEVVLVSNQINSMHTKISDVLHATEEKITSSEYEPFERIIHREIINLKDLLEIEKHKYHVMLQLLTVGNTQSFQIRVDILQLNQLKRAVLLDCYTWDQRLYSLNAFSKELCHTKIDTKLMKFSSKANLGEWGVEIPNKTGMLQNKPEEVTKSLSSSGTRKSSFLNQHQELSFQVSECDIKNMVGMDWSNESIDGYAGVTSCHNSTSKFGDSESEFLENSMSIWFGPSKKIDFGQSGSEQLVIDQTESDLGVDEYELFMDKSSYRKVNYPLRVYSFDSAFRSPERRQRGCLPGSLHLAPVKPFDSSANLASMTRDPITSMRRAYSQNSSREAQKLNNLLSHTPIHFSSILKKLTEGTRLHLPQARPDNIVIAIVDNEPTSIISYAMSSQEYKDYIMSNFYEIEDLNMMGKRSDIGNRVSCYVGATNLGAQQSNPQVNISGGFYVPQLSQGNLLGFKEKHFRIFFYDKYSIPSNMAKFSVTCYFAKQFHALRKQCCPSESDYLRSLSRCKRWNAQGGKSNVYFAKSWDERFIIKQVTKTELDSFKEFAPQYFKYWNQSMLSGSPTSLAKVLGVYQVVTKYSGGREVKMDVLVMENLFFNKNISSVYDLKGSLRSRYNPDTSGNNTVLLDMNLLETKPMFLGRKAKRRLERAIWNDTYFLASIDVMDYSLLVGIDETTKELVIGIIDYMRQYTWDKQLETWVKASGILGGPKNVPPTVISPSQYKKRFRKAISSYFLMIPEELTY